MDARTNTTPAPDASISFADLIRNHRAMMAAYKALHEADDEAADEAQELLSDRLLESRKEILAHRPRTLDEVAVKAGLMMADDAFIFWDVDGTDVEGHFPAVVASLIPAGMDLAPH